MSKLRDVMLSAWDVDFDDGSVVSDPKVDEPYVRAVRTGL